VRSQRPASDYPYFDNGGLPIAFAHRGGRLVGDETPGRENSMAAFQAAVDLGYTYIETDVHATRDGVLIAFHDPTLERTTDAEGVISDLTYPELAKVKIGGTEPIPRFRDLLDSWPDLRINIDAKSPASVPLLVRTIDEHRAWDRVCVASFSPWYLRQLRRLLDPRVATASSALGVAAMMVLPTASLRRHVLGQAGQAAQVPVRRGPIVVVSSSFLDRAHELGKQVHAWTINEPAEMHRLLDLGVDALVTDEIDTLRDVYLARGIWPGGAA
jgi:glycerophosphoryl diester phosphodiesterase